MTTLHERKYLWGCRECGHRYGHAEGCKAKSEASRKAAETRKLNAQRYGDPEAKAAVQVGDIMYGSWGYDQTNVEFYQVVARSGDIVTLRENKTASVATGWLQEKVWPAKDQFTDAAPIRRRLSPTGSVKLEKWGIYLRKLDPRDGGGKYASHYA